MTTPDITTPRKEVITMKFKEFYYKDFRPSYLEGVVRYPEQTDYVIEQNCKPINGKELSEIGLSDLNNLIKI